MDNFVGRNISVTFNEDNTINILVNGAETTGQLTNKRF
jgi:hypothetical protein